MKKYTVRFVANAAKDTLSNITERWRKEGDGEPLFGEPQHERPEVLRQLFSEGYRGVYRTLEVVPPKWYPFDPTDLDSDIYYCAYPEPVSSRDGPLTRMRVYPAKIDINDPPSTGYQIYDLEAERWITSSDPAWKIQYVSPIPRRIEFSD